MYHIYCPTGRAAEYGEFACNVAIGCPNGCTYCYAPGAMHMSRKQFAVPRLRPNFGHFFRIDAKILHDWFDEQQYPPVLRRVFFCFACDPFGTEEIAELTEWAVGKLAKLGIAATILTKRPDFNRIDRLATFPGLRLGCTVTHHDGPDRAKWEPGAAPSLDRLQWLFAAHISGISTWLSLEPVIDPRQTLDIIEATMSRGYIDHYAIGCWNHDKRANDIDWPDFYRRAHALFVPPCPTVYWKRDLCERAGVPWIPPPWMIDAPSASPGPVPAAAPAAAPSTIHYPPSKIAAEGRS